jgi:hypothetical protein
VDSGDSFAIKQISHTAFTLWCASVLSGRYRRRGFVQKIPPPFVGTKNPFERRACQLRGVIAFKEAGRGVSKNHPDQSRPQLQEATPSIEAELIEAGGEGDGLICVNPASPASGSPDGSLYFWPAAWHGGNREQTTENT